MGGRGQTKKQHLKQYEHYRCQAEVVASPKGAEKLSLFSSHKFVDVDVHTVPFTFTDVFHKRLRRTILSNESRPGHLFPKRNTQAPSSLPYSMGQQQKRGLLLQDLEIKSGNSTHSGECHMHACHSPPAMMQGRFGVTYFSMRWWDMFSNRHATMKVARCQLP